MSRARFMPSASLRAAALVGCALAVAACGAEEEVISETADATADLTPDPLDVDTEFPQFDNSVETDDTDFDTADSAI